MKPSSDNKAVGLIRLAVKCRLLTTKKETQIRTRHMAMTVSQTVYGVKFSEKQKKPPL